MRRRAAALLLPLLFVLALAAPSLAGATTKTEEPPPGSVNSAEATQAAAKDVTTAPAVLVNGRSIGVGTATPTLAELQAAIAAAKR